MTCYSFCWELIITYRCFVNCFNSGCVDESVFVMLEGTEEMGNLPAGEQIFKNVKFYVSGDVSQDVSTHSSVLSP